MKNKNKKKIYSVLAMGTSISIVVVVMFLGKMFGRDMSAQQANIQEQFPVKKDTPSLENEFDQLASQEREDLYRTGIILIASVIVSSGLVFAVFVMLRRTSYEPRRLGNG
jgi:hypothetical protein